MVLITLLVNAHLNGLEDFAIWVCILQIRFFISLNMALFDYTMVNPLDLNSCRSSPCLNHGNCSNCGADCYNCQCPSNYTGSRCELCKYAHGRCGSLHHY